jgi:hypothetical protein
MNKRRWSALAGAAVVVAALAALRAKADEGVGPAKDGAAPLLHITPFNTGEAGYCVTCRAGMAPAAITFVWHNDQATQQLLTAADALYRADKDQHLNGAIVILGHGDEANGLKQYVLDHKLALPAALAEIDQGDLPKWRLSDKVPTLVTLVAGHKIKDNLANPSSDALSDGVKAICQ